MKTVFVKYHNGKESIFHTLLDTVEMFCNEHFGSTWPVAREKGAIVHLEDHQPDAELGTHNYDPEPPAPFEPPAPPEVLPQENPGGSDPVPANQAPVLVGLTSAEATTGTGGTGGTGA